MVTVNAIDYDPVVGRFFSPDPFVQIPDFTQSYNRYSYCMNNPVMYNDPEGDFFVVDSWIIGFLSTFGKTWSFKQSLNEANKRAVNDAKIWGGLFVTDPNKSFWGRVGEVVSRLTWQAPQTFLGWVVAETVNTFGLAGGVESVEYKYGATVTRTKDDNWGAVTLGSYITGDNYIMADADNFLFQHEYGHYLQSQEAGFYYLYYYGIPSFLDCLGPNNANHKYHPVEQDANIRAFMYFQTHIEGFNNWNNKSHPISNDYNWSLPFSDENNQQALQNGLLRNSWLKSILFFPIQFNILCNLRLY